MLGVLYYHGTAVTKDDRQAARRILAESIHDHTLLTLMVVNRSHRHRLQRAALRAFYAQTKHLPEWEREFTSRLADIGHPTLVLWETHDKVFPLSVGQAMQRTIPNSEFVVVPNAGHMPQWERPDVVNPAVLKFLACQWAVMGRRSGGVGRVGGLKGKIANGNSVCVGIDIHVGVDCVPPLC